MTTGTSSCTSIRDATLDLTRCIGPAVHSASTALATVARLLPLLMIAAVIAVLLAALLTEWRHRHMRRGARYVAIKLPPTVDEHAATALWTNLVGLLRPRWLRLLLGQPHLAFEIIGSSAGTEIGVWIAGGIVPGLVERAIEAAWPGSQASVGDPKPPLPARRWAAGGVLRMARPEHYPLQSDHPIDALRSLLGAMAGLHDGEVAAVQILARPVTGRRLGRSLRAARERRSGATSGVADSVLDFITPGGPPRLTPPAEDPTRSSDVQHILHKAAQPSWEIAIRYGVSAADGTRSAKRRARGNAHAIASAFSIFSGRNALLRGRLGNPAGVLAHRSFSRGNLVSVRELAALAHLPTDTNVPGISRAGARTVAPGAEIATTGKLLGDATNAGRSRPVALAPEDGRYHMHVMGSTGSGKSTLLTNLILGDVAARRGVVVIDPKGDLIVDILDRLPVEAADRVVLFDPQVRDVIPAMNVLKSDRDDEDADDGDLIVDNLVGIFRRIFEAYWGPRTDDILRAACLTLRDRPETSLADVPRLLTDGPYRKRCIASIRDPKRFSGFWTWYEALGETQQANVIGPVISKLRAFLMRDFVRSIVQPTESSFDMEKVLNGGICLVRIPKGILGDETSRLLGSFVVARVWQAATARARHGQGARVDASLYIDECQNFLNLPRSFDEMLAEARGYRLSLVLAHQHLAQMPRDLRDSVSANARNKVLFTMSPEDAHVLARHVAPYLSEHDLAHLGGYQAAARLMVRGSESPAFTMHTRTALPARDGNKSAILAAIRRRELVRRKVDSASA